LIAIVAYYGLFEVYYTDYAEQYSRDHPGLKSDEYYGGMSRWVRWGSPVVFLMIIVMPFAVALFLDGLFLLIKFSRYRRDHRQFLRKYGRERLYYGP
jgi:hypothetical protein